ncbi:hypothetical protein [Paenibacillus xerothermodurans]|uniref:Magnesium transporter MgtE intracellular domain-containing protein n=1 Tax=Paenibacillus xerothermodurans TaxID=1977292 RepID=A0A2W1P405_PAEXE|nr:hypothetical protein [Paenibacillus xerothermodurans]PZE22452.1 hypothetical protein CBW46_001310 [Paenibacillus xerothermodurans]
MADTDVENGSSYGAMERFLIWFLIPFVFTAVLLGVLLTIFDYDVVNNVLKAANRVPVVNSVIPDPKTASAETEGPVADETTAPTPEETVQSLTSDLQEKEQDLIKSDELLAQRDQAIKELEAKNTALEEQVQAKTQSDEEYDNQVQQLATMYAKMSPSKSAPILENLTTAERVLVLSKMKTDERVKVLEKMDPKIAAESSILLKDQTTARDTQIAALQDRLKQAAPTEEGVSEKLSKDDLGSTFANMTPKSAATVLMEMYKSNPEKVVAILSSMDSVGRSKVITAVAEQSKETAAIISNRLVQ